MEPKKSYMERLLEGLRKPLRQVSAILGQKAPQREAKRLQNRLQEAAQTQNGETLKFETVRGTSRIFEVPGSLFERLNRYGMASDCSLAA